MPERVTTEAIVPSLSNYRVTRYGWKPDLPDHRDKYMLVRVKLDELAPKSDLRPKMPPVYDQGELGSCTANALAAAHQYDQIIQGQTSSFIPSRLAIYYDERKIECTIESDGGAFIRDGMKVLSKYGAASEHLWPYDPTKFSVAPPSEYYAEATLHQSLRYAAVPRSLPAIKTLLKERPIVFGFTVPENFESAECAKTGILHVPTAKEANLGGHAVLMVGYDDHLVFKRGGTTTAVGGVIVRNSWGVEWGDKGYFYMPYEFITNPQLSDDFWVLNTVE